MADSDKIMELVGEKIKDNNKFHPIAMVGVEKAEISSHIHFDNVYVIQIYPEKGYYFVLKSKLRMIVDFDQPEKDVIKTVMKFLKNHIKKVNNQILHNHFLNIR